RPPPTPLHTLSLHDSLPITRATTAIEVGFMNATQWLSERVVARLRPKAAAPRYTDERLRPRLRHGDEALAPRQLRQRLDELKAIVDPLVSEVEGGKRAQSLIDWHARATPAQRHDLWLLMSERFM